MQTQLMVLALGVVIGGGWSLTKTDRLHHHHRESVNMDTTLTLSTLCKLVF